MPVFSGLRTPDRRILVVTGHYGSGKTEFCVSLAMRLARMGYGPYRRLALIDLDIANPYFRSRERKAVLEAAGVGVYGNAYEHEITAELPALNCVLISYRHNSSSPLNSCVFISKKIKVIILK